MTYATQDRLTDEAAVNATLDAMRARFRERRTFDGDLAVIEYMDRKTGRCEEFRDTTGGGKAAALWMLRQMEERS